MRPVRYFPGVPFAGEAPRAAERGDLPREHRGRLRRHRVARRDARGAQGHRVPEPRDGQEDPPGFGHRDQADERVRVQEADPARHSIRHRKRAPQRDAGAQGQHHEVHRGRLPRLGIRTGQGGVLGRLRHRGGSGRQRPAGQDPGQGPHRRLHVPAGAAAARRIRRAGHAQPERRLPVGRLRGPGGRTGDGGGRQYRRRLRGLRSHPRHGPQVRRQGRDQSIERHPVRLDDVPPHGLERGFASSSSGASPRP
jgi:hypothetical protein